MTILFIKHLTLNDALKLQKLRKCRYNSFAPKSKFENQVFEGKTIVSDTKVKFSLIGNSDVTPRPYQVSNDWVFNICEALSHIHKNVKIRKFFASPEKLVKCSYNSFALTPRYVLDSFT